MENTEEMNRLISMCVEIIREDLRGSGFSAWSRLRFKDEGLEVYISGNFLLMLYSRGKLVLSKYLNEKGVTVYAPEPGGWEQSLWELHRYLVLREMEIGGCVIDV